MYEVYQLDIQFDLLLFCNHLPCLSRFILKYVLFVLYSCCIAIFTRSFWILCFHCFGLFAAPGNFHVPLKLFKIEQMSVFSFTLTLMDFNSSHIGLERSVGSNVGLYVSLQ